LSLTHDIWGQTWDKLDSIDGIGAQVEIIMAIFEHLVVIVGWLEGMIDAWKDEIRLQ
jgi:hypothetical protein